MSSAPPEAVLSDHFEEAMLSPRLIFRQQLRQALLIVVLGQQPRLQVRNLLLLTRIDAIQPRLGRPKKMSIA